MKFRKKPMFIEAHQWFKNGDHPEDHADRNWPGEEREGLIVRRFNSSGVDSEVLCKICNNSISVHGWIDFDDGDGCIVCPGDWIITDEKIGYYPMSDKVFRELYEEVIE